MAESDGFVSYVKQLDRDLASWAARVEPGELDPACLVGVVAALEKAERLISVLKGRVAEDAVRRDAWRSSGARSPEAWFAKVTGTSVGAARRRLATEARAATQPEVDQARRAGELSDDQADAVSEAAGDDRVAAAKLVERAKRSTHRQLREDCDRVAAARRRAADEEARRRRLHQERSCRTWVDRDGAGRLDARVTPEALAHLRACLDPFIRDEFDRARQEGRRESHDAYCADALVAMATAATAVTAAASDGGGRPDDDDTGAPYGGPDDDGGPDDAGMASSHGAGDGNDTTRRSRTAGSADGGDRGGRPPAASQGAGADAGSGTAGHPKHRPSRAPATVIAVVSHEALVRGYTEAGETCHLDGIGAVPVTTVRDMMADAFLAAVVTDGTDIRAVTHLGRYPTARQVTALAVRDPCCVVPGCDSRDGLEMDHVTGWAATHTTQLDDLARLCKRHHRMKTYEGWTLTGRPGHWVFEPPGTETRQTTNDPPRAGPGPPGEQAPLFGTDHPDAA